VAASDNNVRRTVCAHDRPDACAVLVTVDAGRVVRTGGDPQYPCTRGFLCGKVHRYAERVHSPERLLTPAALCRRQERGPVCCDYVGRGPGRDRQPVAGAQGPLRW
jgi:anaerobic selenocysteine-containing dehydrogenase